MSGEADTRFSAGITVGTGEVAGLYCWDDKTGGRTGVVDGKARGVCFEEDCGPAVPRYCSTPPLTH